MNMGIPTRKEPVTFTVLCTTPEALNKYIDGKDYELVTTMTLHDDDAATFNIQFVTKRKK
jgi:hypothetical protein